MLLSEKDGEKVLKGVLCLNSGGLLEAIVKHQLKRAPSRWSAEPGQLLRLLSVLLQRTPALNFTIVSFLCDRQDSLDPFVLLSKSKGGHNSRLALLETITRLFYAQPCLRSLWNSSCLVDLAAEGMQPEAKTKAEFLLRWLKHMQLQESDAALAVMDNEESKSGESDRQSEITERLEMAAWADQAIRGQLQWTELADCPEVDIELLREEGRRGEAGEGAVPGLVETCYVRRRLDEAAKKIEKNVW